MQSLHTTDMRLQLQRHIGFVWFPDQQPRNTMMLTKVVIWTTSFKAEWGHQLTGKQTNKRSSGFVWRKFRLLQKSSGCLLPNQHKVSRSERKEKPRVSFRPAAKRLNELKADMWEAAVACRAAKRLLDRWPGVVVVVGAVCLKSLWETFFYVITLGNLTSYTL